MKLTHVRLLVPNIKECFLFYRDVLDLAVRYGNEETPFAEFHTGDINIALEPLLTDNQNETLRPSHELSATDRVALIFSVDDVDETYNHLKGKHVEFVKKPHDTPQWGMRVAYFRDPAGNLIEINTGV